MRSENDKYLLLLILFLSAYVAYIPHKGYDYPVHRDEWDRMTMAKALVKAGHTVYPEPFHGEGNASPSLETGFMVWLAGIKLVSGLPWLAIFKYLPLILSLFLVLSAYIFARRLGYGLEAAFLTSLLPTTLNLLGPAFLVPVSLGLPFILLTLFLAYNFKGTVRGVPLLMILAFLAYTHPPTAVAAFTALGIYLLHAREWRMIAGIGLTAAAITALIPQLSGILLRKGPESLVFTTFISYAELYRVYGYLPSIFFVAGAYLIYRRGRKDATLVYIAILLLLINVAYRQLGWTLLLMPERNYLYLMLLMAVIGGYALSRLRDRRLLIGVALVTLVLSFQGHISTPYYRIIDDREYQDFTWIRDNLEGKAVLDPWKAIAFTAIAEKPVYSRVFPGPSRMHDQRNNEIRRFFAEGCVDTEFLRKNRISIVYAYNPCSNQHLKELRERIYIYTLPPH
jgi:hypothetical protein